MINATLVIVQITVFFFFFFFFLIIHFGILQFVDIDECTSGTHNCHSSLASCTNTVGSFSCSCDNPYTGNGRACNLASGNQLAEYYEDMKISIY